MTPRLYAILLCAYPRAYRETFGKEMLAVFQEAAGHRPGIRFMLSEFGGLLRGAALEWIRHFHRAGKIAAALSALSGTAVAVLFHTLLYTVLVPHAHAQSRTSALPEKQALEVVTTLIRNALAGAHNARTKEDIAKVVDDMDTPDWVSIDPYGYTVATHDEETRQLESMLSVDPDKRLPSTIEILWVHAESTRITAAYVVHSGIQGSAAMPAFRSKDTFGTEAQSRFVLAGSLIRDTFARTANGWRRTRHEKLLPDQFKQIQADSIVSSQVPTAAAR